MFSVHRVYSEAFTCFINLSFFNVCIKSLSSENLLKKEDTSQRCYGIMGALPVLTRTRPNTGGTLLPAAGVTQDPGGDLKTPKEMQGTRDSRRLASAP